MGVIASDFTTRSQEPLNQKIHTLISGLHVRFNTQHFLFILDFLFFSYRIFTGNGSFKESVYGCKNSSRIVGIFGPSKKSTVIYERMPGKDS